MHPTGWLITYARMACGYVASSDVSAPMHTYLMQVMCKALCSFTKKDAKFFLILAHIGAVDSAIPSHMVYSPPFTQQTAVEIT